MQRRAAAVILGAPTFVLRDHSQRATVVDKLNEVIQMEKTMTQIPAAQAVIELDKLLNDAAQGEEIVIIGSDGKAVKLVALTRAPNPIFGSAQGLVNISPDFDDPIDGFEDYMP